MKYINLIFKLFHYIILIFNSMCNAIILKIKFSINSVSYSGGVKCYKSIPSLQINRNAHHVTIGRNVIFNSYGDQSWNCKCKLVVLRGGKLEIGDNSGLNGVMVYCSNQVIIGKNVKIGGGTRISDSNHHAIDYKIRRTSGDSKHVRTAPIIIEDDVFIGASCYIGKGLTIGARSIVAAGSVVIKSIPADEIWGGNPAQFIKKI